MAARRRRPARCFVTEREALDYMADRLRRIVALEHRVRFAPSVGVYPMVTVPLPVTLTLRAITAWMLRPAPPALNVTLAVGA